MSLQKFSLTILIALIALPLLAAEPLPVKPGIMEGPNLTLAIIALILLFAIISLAGILRTLAGNAPHLQKLRKMKDSGTTKILILISVFGTLGTQVQAQTVEQPAFPEIFDNTNTVLLLILNFVLILVFLYMVSLVRSTLKIFLPAPDPVMSIESEDVKKASPVMAALTDAVPLEREHEILMDHEYDGIHELDNNLPPWWVWMFNLTIVFAVVYMIWFHVLPYGNSQSEEYVAEVELATQERLDYIAKMGESVNENTVTLLTSESDLQAGKNIYNANCQACHLADGGGSVGPNLTDKYWIHGGSIHDIFKTIKYGVPAKGMISWESQLRPKEMAQVTSYILTLQGTTPAAPKEPEGELYVDPDVTLPDSILTPEQRREGPPAFPVDSTETVDALKTASNP